MRVTTFGQSQALIAQLQSSRQALAQAQERVTTGKKVSTMSDDPAAGSAILHADGALRGLDQYGRAADRAIASLDAADGAMQQLGDLLDRAKELAVSANTSGMSPVARQAAAAEVQQLLEQAVSLGNTRVGGEYVFGGTSNDGRAPFDAAATNFVPLDGGTPRYPTGTRAVEVGPNGETLAGAPDGTGVLLGYSNGAPTASTGVLPALRQLQQALATGQQAPIPDALAAIGSAADGLQVRVGELGARQNQADLLKTGFSALQATLTQRRSDLSDVDVGEAVADMVARQTAYQAAMLASSKVMGLSLTDYLR